ncbi:MAG: transglycosylase SLT domain-containing protein [Candidatus Gracilibacteria bacterium]|nr:transglycosylase SLT domain-containing protein [Candidatus Gracilibacteria bacterium]
MTEIKEKKDNLEQNNNKISPSKKVEELIVVLEEKLKNTQDSDYFKKQLLENQINSLKKIKNKYDKLEQNGITDNTKQKLNYLLSDLKTNITESKAIGKLSREIQDTLDNEEIEKKDTLFGGTTTRDLIERNMKFRGFKNRFIETEFMTNFYNSLTFSYLNYTKNKDIKVFDIDKESVIKLIKDIIKQYIDRGEQIDNEILEITLSTNERIIIDLDSLKRQEIDDKNREKVFNITAKTHDLNRVLVSKNIEEIKGDILDLQNYRDKIKSIYGINLEEDIDTSIFQINKNLIIQIKVSLRTEIDKIKEIINQIEVYNDNDVKQKLIKLKIDKIKNLTQKFGIDLKEGNELFYESSDVILSKLFEKKKILSKILEIELLISKINKGDFKTINSLVNNKIEDLENILKSSTLFPDNESNEIIKDLRDKFIKKLLQYYLESLGIKEINSRGDISNSDFFIALTEANSRKEISKANISEIITEGYYQAFVKELQTKEGKESLNNLRKYERVWKEKFKEKLGDIIGGKKAEDMFLLSFIESNAKPSKSSEAGAIGYFQMLPDTAKKYGMRSESDLNKPGKSAEISANYVKDLLLINQAKDLEQSEKTNIGTQTKDDDNEKIKIEAQKGGISVDMMISNALFQYNGNWSNRLKEYHREDIKKTIIEISKELNYCKIMLKKGKISVSKAIELIKSNVSDKYFNEDVSKGTYHLGILDKYKHNKKLSKNEIINWIDDYTSSVLTQQYLYPEQFNAAKKAYKEVK